MNEYPTPGWPGHPDPSGPARTASFHGGPAVPQNGGSAPVSCCQPGYGAPVPPVPVGQPVYGAVYPAAPPFVLGGAKRGNPRVKEASRTLNRMCLLVVAQSVTAALWGVVFSVLLLLAGVNSLWDPMAALWSSAALVPLSTALPFFVYLLAGKKDPARFLCFEKVGFVTGLLCVLAGLGLCLIANYPVFFLQDLLSNWGYDASAAAGGLPEEISWPCFLLELAATGILVPVMEEFAFRGVLLSSLRRHGEGFAVLLSALLFASVHLDIAGALFAFFAGLIFGFLYLRTGNLWLPIIIHALNNFLAVCSGYGELIFSPERAELAAVLTMLVPMALGMIALVLLLVFKRRVLWGRAALPLGDGPLLQPLTGGQGFAAMVRAPLFWAVLLLPVWYTATLFW